MGKWSQYRKRGGGGVPAVAGPSGPPLPKPDGASFTVTGADSQILIDNFGDCLVGANGWGWRIGMVDGVWTESADDESCASSVTPGGVFVPGQDWFVQVQWQLFGVAQSDWSNSFPVTIGA